MLNRSASLAMSTCILKALPVKLDIKRHSPSVLYVSIKTIWNDLVNGIVIIDDSFLGNMHILINSYGCTKIGRISHVILFADIHL